MSLETLQMSLETLQMSLETLQMSLETLKEPLIIPGIIAPLGYRFSTLGE